MNKKLQLAWCLSLVILTANAQHKNVEIGVLSDTEKRSIPAAAISRRDAKFLVVKGAGSTFYLSSDGGLTWQTSTAEGMQRAEWLTMHSDSKGNLFAVYATPVDNHFRIMVSESKDNGKVWSSGVTVSPVAADQKYPGASFDTKGNLLVTWTENVTNSEGKCESAIMMSTSSNGSKWSKPMRVSQLGGVCDENNEYATGGIPAVAPDGKSFVSWSNNGKIFLDRSFSSNFWLENDIVVHDITPGWKLSVPGYSYVAAPPQLVVDQTKGTYHGCIYITWSDQKDGEGDTNVLFTRSNNYGDNWASPSKLSSGETKGEQYGSRMAIDQSTGYIYVLFFDRSAHEDDQTDVVLAYSNESGGSFKTITVSETPFVPDDKSGAGVYLDIAVNGGVIVPVWTRTHDGHTSLWTTTIRQDELIKAVEQSKSKKKK
ncbi:sialidase family protein [Chryseolinea sp. T2]|uniref:sialidase family protein n=1 Tax=Chryseolinea sp. T2 TaxID=3129255 RepID=UPI0030787B3A